MSKDLLNNAEKMLIPCTEASTVSNKRPIHPSTIVSLIVTLFGILVLYIFNWSNYSVYTDLKKDFYKKRASHSSTLSVATSALNGPGLVYDLINMDVANKIVNDEIAQKARQKVTLYLDDVKKSCKTNHTNAGNEDFVKCAGNKVAEHFYYRPGAAVTAHYADDNSDCDASTYLMMTAAYQAGIESWVVYSPSHAFFAWKDSFGNYHYWETTSHNNLGKWADFNDPLYKKAISPAYYRPRDSKFTVQYYQAIIYSQARNKAPLDTGLIPLLDNQFVSDILLYNKAESGKLTDKDAALLRAGLQEDFTSTDRNKALAIYFLAHGDKKQAASYLSNIDYQDCYTSCVKLLSDTSTVTRKLTFLYPWLDGIHDRHDASLSLLYYYIFLSGVILTLVGVISGLTRIFPRKIKNIFSRICPWCSSKNQTTDNTSQSE